MIFTRAEHRKIRQNFPVTKKSIFFNNAGVAPVSLPALKAINAVADDICNYGYLRLPRWYEAILHARKDAAGLINASPDEIAFVKNTSHGLSLVAGGIDWKRGDEVIITDQEFPANVYPWMNLKEKGVKIKTVRGQNGKLIIGQFARAVSRRTRLISVSSVEYATGFRNDLAALGRLCGKHGILFCVDGIQSLGAIPMDVKKCKIDFMAVDGHKWLVAPEGIGIFYCRKSALKKLKLVVVGWNTVCDSTSFHKINFKPKYNAERFEEGSHNLIGIHALAASIRLLRSIGIEKIEQWNIYLADLLIKGLKERGVELVSSLHPEERSSIVSFTTGSRSKDKLLFNYLIGNRIIVALRGEGIRISPHFYNTPDEITKFFQVISKIL